MKTIDGSRVFIAVGHKVVQFDYINNNWIYTIELPNTSGDQSDSEILAIELDKNYELWAGTVLSGLFHYSGEVLDKWFQIPEIPSPRIHDIVISNNNEIFCSTDGGGVFSVLNNTVTTYDFFNGHWEDVPNIAIDSSGNILANTEGALGYKYNGNN